MNLSWYVVLAVCLLTMLFSGCDDEKTGGNATGPKQGPSITVESLGLQGTVSEPAIVTVNDVADQDGAIDMKFIVELPLGGGTLISDPPVGSQATGTFVLSVVDNSGNAGGLQVDYILIN